LKMILLHDLAEAEIGDYTPGQISAVKKNELENNAISKIFENLPESVKSQYQKIWNQYQENKTPESELVHQIDKLEMVLQAKLYEKDGYSKEKLQSFIESAKQEITNPKLKELFTKIIEDN
ncbi:MAG: HD family hydrolase, partial [Candidatus Nitrosomaritimum aestuariumsis]